MNSVLRCQNLCPTNCVRKQASKIRPLWCSPVAEGGSWRYRHWTHKTLKTMFSPSQRKNPPISTQHQYLCSSTFNCKSAVATSMVWYLPHDIFCFCCCPELLWCYGSHQVQREWNQTLLQIPWQVSRKKDRFHRRRGKWVLVIPSLALGHLLPTWCLWHSHSWM